MTQITVLDPFAQMRSRMRRALLSDRGLHVVSRFDRAVRQPADAQPVALRLDVYEIDDGLTIEAPLPGFGRDEVEVTLEKGKLSIRAEHREQSDEDGVEERRYVRRERFGGRWFRSLFLGDAYDPDSVRAGLKDGLLTISINKLAQALPKRIAIETAG